MHFQQTRSELHELIDPRHRPSRCLPCVIASRSSFLIGALLHGTWAPKRMGGLAPTCVCSPFNSDARPRRLEVAPMLLEGSLWFCCSQQAG
eukprot:1288620-Amphidinium_carterae.1